MPQEAEEIEYLEDVDLTEIVTHRHPIVGIEYAVRPTKYSYGLRAL